MDGEGVADRDGRRPSIDGGGGGCAKVLPPFAACCLRLSFPARDRVRSNNHIHRFSYTFTALCPQSLLIHQAPPHRTPRFKHQITSVRRVQQQNIVEELQYVPRPCLCAANRLARPPQNRGARPPFSSEGQPALVRVKSVLDIRCDLR